MRFTTSLLILLIALSTVTKSCEKNRDEDIVHELDVSFELPASIDIYEGAEYAFKAKDGKLPEISDQFFLKKGVLHVFPIVDVSANSFTVKFNDVPQSDSYSVYIKRGERRKLIGTVYVNIVSKISGFEPDKDTNLYGVVSSNGEGVPNVVVSDGIDVTVTDGNGIYQLASSKKLGYVFLSVPSGYEAPSNGVLPAIHQQLRGDINTLERIDFTLNKLNRSQDNFTLLTFGDIHLADRTGDLAQFRDFAKDISAYINSTGDKPIYAVTLGDMTWELYWYSRNFGFTEYINTLNEQIKGLQIFQCMGNHDNDYKVFSDWEASSKYAYQIAPTYYSFNIGKVHFVVLDNIDCSDYDGTTSRRYKQHISNEQLNWLRKDLSYVDKSTPIIVVKHIHVFYPSSTTSFRIDHDEQNVKALFDVLDGYKTRFITGHTHTMHNVTPDDGITGKYNIYEHNAGAVCGSWWWSGHLTPGIHLGPDGSPGGFGVWNFEGSDVNYVYKATGHPESYQFRAYDLNSVSFSLADIPNCPLSVQSSFKKYIETFPENSNNEVLINIWNWSRNSSLKVVDERGKELGYTQVTTYDPLHISALTIPRFNNANITSEPYFTSSLSPHFLKVKVDDADADLTITFTDEYDNSWTEKMQRPKAYSVEEYRRK